MIISLLSFFMNGNCSEIGQNNTQKDFPKKRCLHCNEDISHKGKKAKYCHQSCKNHYTLKLRAEETRNRLKENPIIITCKNCDVSFCIVPYAPPGVQNAKFCSDECEREYRNQLIYLKQLEKRQREYTKGEDGYDFIKCEVCGFLGEDLSLHLKLKHNITPTEYKNQYGQHLKIKCEKIAERFKGENNPGYQHNGKLSPWSYNNLKMIKEEVDECKARTKYHKSLNPLANGYTLTFEYFLELTNGDEVKARKLQKERQTTFSLKKCIEKYGEEKGRERWLQRQEKWLKSYRKQNFSNISQELFQNIVSQLNIIEHDIYFATYYRQNMEEYVNKEYFLKGNGRIVRPDFICLNKKKIIEFDGDYWHRPQQANPTREKERDEFIKSLGFEVMHVREYNYNKNKQVVIDQCIKFLTK